MNKKNKKPELFFLGTIRQARDDWAHWMAEPEAATEKTIAKKKEEQKRMAPQRCMSGYVSELCLIDRDGTVILNATTQGGSGDYFTPGNMLIDFLTANPDYCPAVDPMTLDDVGIRWFGFDIREVLANIAFTSLASGTEVPPGVWLYRPFTVAPFADPYEMLVPSQDRRDFALDALCEYFHMLDLYKECNCAQAWAELARQLVYKGNLVPF